MLPLPEHRFDVKDGGTVQRFEMLDSKPAAVDRDDLHGVKADRVRAIGRAGGEGELRRIAWEGCALSGYRWQRE